ncbi:uncharacterized protein LOC126267520 [Schistocerca gregaria]|uniref:uncharacterized protein LOC126267520 n=1 Tax=Schistocerca gregaria TaxID=7010 RepID=UPI00211F02F5|nr:uncharacterized protein LOC126267520 [Schistocerca gregaria]
MTTGSMCTFLLALLAAASLQSDSTRAAFVKRRAVRGAALSPEDYFASLVDQFDDAVRSLGFYNLPIHDFTKELDETVYDIKLEGQCAYSFGYVTNMDPFLVGKTSWGDTVTYFDGYLRGYVDLPNIEVIYDFQATLTVGDVSGTATHGYPNSRIEVTVQRNTTVEGSTPKASAAVSATSSANYTAYVPDTNVTRALARVARFETGYIFWDDVVTWCSDVFPSILQQIVDSMEFPL